MEGRLLELEERLLELEGRFVVSGVTVARPGFAVASSSGTWEGAGTAVQIITVPSAEPVANLRLDAP